MCPYPSCTRIGQLGTVLSTTVLLVWAVVSVSLVKYRSNDRNCLIRPRGANVVDFVDANICWSAAVQGGTNKVQQKVQNVRKVDFEVLDLCKRCLT